MPISPYILRGLNWFPSRSIPFQLNLLKLCLAAIFARSVWSGRLANDRAKRKSVSACVGRNPISKNIISKNFKKHFIQESGYKSLSDTSVALSHSYNRNCLGDRIYTFYCCLKVHNGTEITSFKGLWLCKVIPSNRKLFFGIRKIGSFLLDGIKKKLSYHFRKNYFRTVFLKTVSY